MTALAHAHDDDAAAAGEHPLHRRREGVAGACLQAEQGPGFDVERAVCQRKRARGLECGSSRHRSMFLAVGAVDHGAGPNPVGRAWASVQAGGEHSRGPADGALRRHSEAAGEVSITIERF